MNTDLKSILASAENFVSRGCWREAADIYGRLAVMCPREPGIHHMHGLVLMEEKRWQAAVEAIDRGISLAPDNAAFHRSKGDVLMSSGDPQRAAKAYTTMLALKPQDVDGMIRLGNAYHSQGFPTKAMECYHRALSLSPGNLMAMNNIGKTYHDQGDIKPALLWYEKALDIDATYAEARFNRSIALLATGDFSRGWQEYEWRFRRKSANSVYPHNLTAKRWDGSAYPGKRLLIHCEQGMGDVVQFCRYLPMVKSLGGTLIVEAHAPLVPLLRTMDCIDELICFNPRQAPCPVFDVYYPLLSLPALFQASLASIPGQTPYLTAEAPKVAQWRAKASGSSGMKIGFVWSGSATDPLRQCPIQDLAHLFSLDGACFFSFQKDASEEDLEMLSQYANVTHWGDQLMDFADTAAALVGMDLVITIDTAAAHLAGAMGVPVWILLPVAADWRWLLEREDSPWYPSARLFRLKKAGAWPELIDSVMSELKQLSAATRAFKNGCVWHEAGRLDDAIAAYRYALGLSPDLTAAHRNLGLVYFQKGQLQDAAGSYERCLRLEPDSPEVLSNLGSVYQRLRMPSKARNCYLKALHADPRHTAACYNLGNTYLEAGDLKAAVDYYQQALDSDPTHLSSLCNMGRALHRLGRIDDALNIYNQGLQISPTHPELRFNRGIALLLQGRWSEGWPDYAYRFKCHNRTDIYPHKIAGRRWQGQPFDGRTLLVHGEQGLGDALQFVRFLPMVKQLGGKVILETHRSLLSLFSSVQGIDELTALSPRHPPAVDYDIFIPLCSLAAVFNLTPDRIPDYRPYLFAREDKMKQWQARLPDSGTNVGLVWSGSNTYPERSCRIQDLASLLRTPGVNWIGLQKDHANEKVEMPASQTKTALMNWGPEFDDFSDTAAAIACLDLIISIDTSVAHLAAAMGKPVWLLLPAVPDWRWLLRKSDTPWYATMRLFRQKQAGNWQTVMQAIGRKLAEEELI